MSLLLGLAAEVEPTQPIARRRSGLPLVAALVALVGVAASLVLSAPRLASFEPVSPRSAGTPYITVPEYGVHGSYILGYQHGVVARLTLPLHNSGPLPVTITAVDLGNGPMPLLSVRSFEGLPLTLRPGGSGQAIASIPLVNCRFYNEREMQTYAGITVDFTSLGRAGTRWVGFDRPIYVKSPMLASCPDRQLDRHLNRRSTLL
ncbi:MAG: hypothetical protein ABIO67_10950 [Mycobacteriales bacterium]